MSLIVLVLGHNSNGLGEDLVSIKPCPNNSTVLRCNLKGDLKEIAVRQTGRVCRCARKLVAVDVPPEKDQVALIDHILFCRSRDNCQSRTFIRCNLERLTQVDHSASLDGSHRDQEKDWQTNSQLDRGCTLTIC